MNLEVTAATAHTHAQPMTHTYKLLTHTYKPMTLTYQPSLYTHTSTVNPQSLCYEPADQHRPVRMLKVLDFVAQARNR